ncbi:hypothetical protein ACFLWC_07335 [Chloroflexota bacterium]
MAAQVTGHDKHCILEVNRAAVAVGKTPVVKYLEQARIVASEARNIPNLPQYVDQHLLRIIGEIDRAIGGSQWEPEGRLKAGIQSVRESLPDGAVDEERKRIESGSQLALVA